ncbi:hypothetical protein NKH77_38010 [Streptomyces sp. M19]
MPGTVKGHDALLTDARTGRGPLGEPPAHPRSPLAPAAPAGSVALGTAPGSLVEDVPVTAPDGATVRLWERLGGRLLVVLVAPGTGVWDRRHWLGAGLMPRLATAVSALPVRAELLVAEAYPGAPAHTVLVVRPDGHLVAALAGCARRSCTRAPTPRGRRPRPRRRRGRAVVGGRGGHGTRLTPREDHRRA